MKKLTLISLTLLMIALFAVPALAKHDDWPERDNQEGHQMKRVKQLELLLDLSPSQSTEIREIIAKHREQSIERREIARANREEVAKLMRAENLNESRLRTLLHEQADLKAQKMVNKHSIRAEINLVLTPEQQEKRDALRQMKKPRKSFSKKGRPGHFYSDPITHKNKRDTDCVL